MKMPSDCMTWQRFASTTYLLLYLCISVDIEFVSLREDLCIMCISYLLNRVPCFSGCLFTCSTFAF